MDSANIPTIGNNNQTPSVTSFDSKRSINNLSKIPGKVIFEIKPPKDIEKSPSSFAQTLLSLTHIKRPSIFDRLLGKSENITFEIAVVDSKIHFYAIVPENLSSYFMSQITASYPSAGVIILDSDYLSEEILKNPEVVELVLSSPYYLPLRTYKQEKDTDPLSAILGSLSKVPFDGVVVFQINLANGGNWQGFGREVIQKGIIQPDGTTKAHPQATLITEKIGQKGFEVSMRLLSASPEREATKANLANTAGSFGSFSLGEGNTIKVKKGGFLKNSNLKVSFLKRDLSPRTKYQYLNVDEVATLFHLPDLTTSKIKNVTWGGQAFNEPPQNLPVATNLSDDEKQSINFFAKTEYKNHPTTFGIKDGEDRRKHFYIIGKTGTGKSTLIANMAISDIRKGHGVAIIDPHGDLSDIIMDFIPARRINDVCYLDPSITDRSFHLNAFEVASHEQGDIVASGIVSIFYKLYSYSWGPRLEYILRNTVLTLVKRSGSTMLDIPKILTENGFRRNVVENLEDEVLKNFWLKEYNSYSDNFKSEAIAPILNKVGQFLSSTKIRNVVGSTRSTINLEKMMNEGKIIILNLSQGKLGEDNSALLGALFITKFQLAAMNRVNLPEGERKDFYLYVDEFQNFATSSFIKILSEARKYRLNLILANQYVAQLSEEIQKAIFGNVGSLICFTIGSLDALLLAKEFSNKLTDADLVALGKFQIALKLSIENMTSQPFLAQTLPLPDCKNQNRDKVLRSSMERFTKPIINVSTQISEMASENTKYEDSKEVGGTDSRQRYTKNPPVVNSRGQR